MNIAHNMHQWSRYEKNKQPCLARAQNGRLVKTWRVYWYNGEKYTGSSELPWRKATNLYKALSQKEGE